MDSFLPRQLGLTFFLLFYSSWPSITAPHGAVVPPDGAAFCLARAVAAAVRVSVVSTAAAVPASAVSAAAADSASVLSGACSLRSVARLRLDTGIHGLFSDYPLLSYYSALFLLRSRQLPMFRFSSVPAPFHWVTCFIYFSRSLLGLVRLLGSVPVPETFQARIQWIQVCHSFQAQIHNQELIVTELVQLPFVSARNDYMVPFMFSCPLQPLLLQVVAGFV